MKKLSMTLAALGMTIALVGVAGAGGQARVKVEQVPGKVEAGKPFELAITVQPQTWSHARNIEPIVTAECAGRKVATTAVASKRVNQYRATLNLPTAGEWKIRVDSRYCHTVMSPVSVQVAAAAAKRAKSAG
jgi:hypothetical protein